MFLNKKRLLLTLYRLEEGQQDILRRLDELERRGGTSSVLPSASHLLLQGEGCGGTDTSSVTASPCHLPLEGKALSPSSEREGNITPDTWIIDGIEAILSYRRDKESNK